MTLIYSAGDIVFFRNVMFNDVDGKKRLDTRISGHPFLVLNDVENFGDKCHALKITSRKLDYIHQYSLEKCATVPWLKKDSFVNFNKMFDFSVDKNVIPCCRLKAGYFEKICREMQKGND